MTKKEKSELSQLNQKFDALIQILLDQHKNKQVEQIEESIDEITKENFPTPVVPNKSIPKVSLYVDPNAMIKINGVAYEGAVTVNEDLAVELRRALFEWKRSCDRVMRDMTHPTRQHTVAGNL